MIDSGKGIPSKALPFIFDRFYQADSARHAAGSGLGLAVSANLAHAMGMELTAHLSDAAPRSLSITLACPR